MQAAFWKPWKVLNLQTAPLCNPWCCVSYILSAVYPTRGAEWKEVCRVKLRKAQKKTRKRRGEEPPFVSPFSKAGAFIFLGERLSQLTNIIVFLDIFGRRQFVLDLIATRTVILRKKKHTQLLFKNNLWVDQFNTTQTLALKN